MKIELLHHLVDDILYREKGYKIKPRKNKKHVIALEKI